MIIDNREEDVIVFGENKWVHCESHGYPHTTGWCSVSVKEKTLLESDNLEDCEKECREKGLWLYKEKYNG